jgi:protein TonB
MAVVILAPLVASNDSEPIEFVAVQIVPIQALGIEEPAPAPTRQAPKPKPKETPKVEEPEPESEKAESSEPAPTTIAQPSTKPKVEAKQDSSSASESPSDPTRRQGSPLGSSLGTSTFGAAVGGLDNPDFVYSYYVDQMLGMISSNWQRPALGGKVEAMVHFRIHTDGSITDLRIVTSSGYNSFDLAGLRAVQLAVPFPPFPQSYRHKSLGVNLILR